MNNAPECSTTVVQPRRTFAVTRKALFPTPAWVGDLELTQEHRYSLQYDADRLLERHRAHDRPFEQTAIVEPFASGRVWDSFFEAMAALVGAAIESWDPVKAEPAQHRTHATWVLRIRSSTQFQEAGGVVDLLHAHHRSLIATVYYLAVPVELEGAERGGTLLRSPAGPLGSDFFDSNVYVPAREGEVLLFPASVEHAPAQPDQQDDFSTPRVVLVSNWT